MFQKVDFIIPCRICLTIEACVYLVIGIIPEGFCVINWLITIHFYGATIYVALTGNYWVPVIGIWKRAWSYYGISLTHVFRFITRRTFQYRVLSPTISSSIIKLFWTPKPLKHEEQFCWFVASVNYNFVALFRKLDLDESDSLYMKIGLAYTTW